MCHKRPVLKTQKRQAGFLIPLAAFLVVAMSILAATIVRTSSQATIASAQELISTQTFYAAESGAQAAMSRLFVANSNRTSVDNICAGINNTIDFEAQAVPGLGNCSAAVTCDCRYQNNSACDASVADNYNGVNGLFYSFYTVTSVGRCGSASVTSNRTVQVSAFNQ